MLPGVHRVRKTRADGTRVEFWYAWRGGPQILQAEAKSDEALQKAVAAKAAEAAAKHQALAKPQGNARFFDGIITKYLTAMEADGSLAPRTKSDRRKQLSRVRTDLGEMETRAFAAKGARAFLLRWRKRYAATPKTADDLLGAVSSVLKWAIDGGEESVSVNPVAEFPRLYKSNRADVIWRPQDLALIEPHCAPELWLAVRLAANTGLRLGDLIKLPRNAIGTDAIVWQTGKSRGRRTVIIPITDELRQVIATIPKAEKATTVLTSARKRPWTEAGLESAIRRAKLDARAKWRKTMNDPLAESPVDKLRFHDLRGTAATYLILGGLEIGEVGTVLGWKKDKVEQIAARYVSAEAIGRAMVQRLRSQR